MSLPERLTALEEAAALGTGREPAAALERMTQVSRSGAERRALSDEHTVVGFFGATGSGKSSLFNAVVGENIARTHVTRPTTSVPLAAVWQPEGADALLDWLAVADRAARPGEFAQGAGPLILLDLPDFDSVRAEHREIAERLAGQVDVLVWVVDPEKYADAVMHRDFITPHAGHAAVTLAVVNKIDMLSERDAKAVTRSFAELLRRDGLGKVHVVPASARTGEGIEDVRRRIAEVARGRQAQQARIEADVLAATGEWGNARAPKALPRDAERDLTLHLSKAADVDRIARATGASYRKRLGQRTGWLVTSWLRRLRPDPLRRLGLRDEADTAGVRRTSLPALSAAGKAQAGRGVRDYATRASADLPGGWQDAVFETAERSLTELPEELDRAIARTKLPAGISVGWWIITALQWIALLAVIAGLGWYALVWLMPTLGFNLPWFQPQIPTWEGWPIPLLLIAGGIALGLLMGFLTWLFGLAAGRIRERRARRRLQRQVNATAREVVMEPILDERERYAHFLTAVQRARS